MNKRSVVVAIVLALVLILALSSVAMAGKAPKPGITSADVQVNTDYVPDGYQIHTYGWSLDVCCVGPVTAVKVTLNQNGTIVSRYMNYDVESGHYKLFMYSEQVEATALSVQLYDKSGRLLNHKPISILDSITYN